MILLVEDDRPIRDLITYVLNSAGHRVLTAATGEKGLELLRCEHPDLVMLDMYLPGMNGRDVLETIRNDRRAADTTVIAFTTIAMPGDRDRIVQAGFDGLIEKPIDPTQLVDDVADFLAAKHTRTAARPG